MPKIHGEVHGASLKRYELVWRNSASRVRGRSKRRFAASGARHLYLRFAL